VTERHGSAAPVALLGSESLRDQVMLVAIVGFGAAIGGVARALVSLGALQFMGPGFPWGTLLVNAVGSLAIGFYATVSEPDGRLPAGTRQRQFVMTGICGGFTTFSLFSLETLQLAQAGRWGAVAAYVFASVAVWIAAVWLGHRAALRIDG
jgi:fluoride exporter